MLNISTIRLEFEDKLHEFFNSCTENTNYSILLETVFLDEFGKSSLASIDRGYLSLIPDSITLFIEDTGNITRDTENIARYLSNRNDDIACDLYWLLSYAKMGMMNNRSMQQVLKSNMPQSLYVQFPKFMDYANIIDGNGMFLNLLKPGEDFWLLPTEYAIARGKEIYNFLHPENQQVLPINMSEIKKLLYSDAYIPEFPPLIYNQASLNLPSGPAHMTPAQENEASYRDIRCQVAAQYAIRYKHITDNLHSALLKVFNGSLMTDNPVKINFTGGTAKSGKIKKTGGVRVFIVLMNYIHNPSNLKTAQLLGQKGIEDFGLAKYFDGLGDLADNSRKLKSPEQYKDITDELIRIEQEYNYNQLSKILGNLF